MMDEVYQVSIEGVTFESNSWKEDTSNCVYEGSSRERALEVYDALKTLTGELEDTQLHGRKVTLTVTQIKKPDYRY